MVAVNLEVPDPTPAEDAAPQVRALDHIAIAVEDLEAAIDWYTGVLGFRCVERRRTRGASTGMISAVLAQGDVIVVLVQGTERESQVSKFIAKFGPGVQHIAFAVDDLTKTIERAKGAGANGDTETIEDVGIRQVFLRRDPGSGVRIELIERKGGDFSDKSVEQLFRSFEARDLY